MPARRSPATDSHNLPEIPSLREVFLSGNTSLVVVETQYAASLRVGYIVEANRSRHVRLLPGVELFETKNQTFGFAWLV